MYERELSGGLGGEEFAELPVEASKAPCQERGFGTIDNNTLGYELTSECFVVEGYLEPVPVVETIDF